MQMRVLIAIFPTLVACNSRLYEHAHGTRTASGWVFEDPDTSLPDMVPGPPLVNAAVELYDDGGQLVAEVTTDENGYYEFTGLLGGEYMVRVRSSSVADEDTVPAAGFAACVPGCGYPVAEMIWPMLGGQSALVDDTTAAGPGDTYRRVVVPSDEPIDFGFSFVSVVNTSDGGQGSLRQVIENTNRLAAAATVQFVVVVEELTDGRAVFEPRSPLPAIESPHLTLAGGGQVTLDGARSPSGNGLVVAAADVELSGLVIQGFVDAGVALRASRVRLAESSLAENGTGVSVESGQTVTVDRNTIVGNRTDGVRVAAEGGARLFHNTIHDNGNNGATLLTADAVVRNNLFTGNPVAGVHVAGAGPVVDYNGFFANGVDCDGCTVGDESVLADPAYVDATSRDFSLAGCTSPAVNRGLDLNEDQSDGNDGAAGLYQGPFPDLGAVESSCSGQSCVVSNTADGGTGSLRDCLANVTPGMAITFDIGEPTNASADADTWWRIDVSATALEVTGQTLAIDGATQTANRGNTNSRGPEIELTSDGALTHVVELTSTKNVVVRELVLNGASNAQLYLFRTTQTKVHGCYIGTDAVGESSAGSAGGGITLFSGGTSDNDIGGPRSGQGNLISGNGYHGIAHNTASTHNRVRGNRIGTDRTGSLALGNTECGVSVAEGSDIIIGGAAPREGNIISANGYAGIRIATDAAHHVFIYGNVIGTGLLGTEQLGNQFMGVRLSDGVAGVLSRIVIGGTAEGQGNVIAFNGFGAAPDSTSAGDGVHGSWNVGKDDEVVGNFIHHNHLRGIYFQRHEATLSGNTIWANGTEGIWLNYGVSDTRIHHNTIHGNGGDGVIVGGDETAAVANNIITANDGTGLRWNVSDTTELVERYNLIGDDDPVWGNSGGPSNLELSSTDTNGEPGFMDAAAGDFRLECAGAAVDRGEHQGMHQLDVNGGAPGMFNGVAPDLGAHESSCD